MYVHMYVYMYVHISVYMYVHMYVHMYSLESQSDSRFLQCWYVCMYKHAML
jgi:hypothetical protein